MDRCHAESAELCVGRRVCKGLDSLLDDLLRHGRDELPERIQPVDRPVDLVTPCRADVGIGAEVGKLDGGNGAMAAYCRGQPMDRRERRRIIEVEIAQANDTPLAVRCGRTDVDRRCTSHCLALVKGNRFVDGIVPGREILVADGGGKTAVPKKGIAEPDGREQMGIPALEHVPLCHPLRRPSFSVTTRRSAAPTATA